MCRLILNCDGDKQFQVKGEVPLKMSDFGIDPPTAMMGTLKTGNEVVIKYNLEFEKAPDSYSLNNQKQLQVINGWPDERLI